MGAITSPDTGGMWRAPVVVQNSATDQQALPANPFRRLLIISNDSPSKLYILFHAGMASPTNFTYVIPPGTAFNTDGFAYNGEIHAVWSALSQGNAAFTEVH